MVQVSNSYQWQAGTGMSLLDFFIILERYFRTFGLQREEYRLKVTHKEKKESILEIPDSEAVLKDKTVSTKEFCQLYALLKGNTQDQQTGDIYLACG